MMYKNIRIKMRDGKSRLQRVRVLASGKYKFVKNLSKSKPSTAKAKTKSNKKRSVKRTGKPKGKRRGGRILGAMGWKGLLVGTVVLTATKYLAKRFAPIPPRYVNGAAMVGASFIPMSGVKTLRAAGIMDLASEFGSDLIAGFGVGVQLGGVARGYDL